MTDVTVRQFADVVGLPVERLLVQLGEAGLSISDADETISDKEKMQLLSYLRKSHGKSESLSVSQPKKVTLKRRSHSELRTTAGRGLYAIGHNEEAARFSGIPVDRLKLLLYTATGLLAAIASLSYSTRRSATAEAGTGMELDVITAVVVGGTSIYGGRGNIVGTLLGVLLIHETRQFVDWHWQRSELTLMVIGALLILSVLGHRVLFPRHGKTGQA